MAKVAILGDGAEEDGNDAEMKEERLHQVEEERPLKRLAEKMEREQSAERDSEIDGAGGETKNAADEGTSEAEDLRGQGEDGGTDGDVGAENRVEKRSTTPEGSPPLAPIILNPNDGELDRLTKVSLIRSQISHNAYRISDLERDSWFLLLGL